MPRYKGAETRVHPALSRDQVVISTSRVIDEQAAGLIKRLSGNFTHIDYASPRPRDDAGLDATMSVLQAAGFRTVFSCVGEKACDSSMRA